jgi:hypothetical protein
MALMQGKPPMLDLEMLHKYDARLCETGVPVDDWARPGLSEREMDEMLAPLGLTLPAEARLWWMWRNGEEESAERRLWRPWRRGLSLDGAIAQYRLSRLVAKNSAEKWDDKERDDIWHPAWFPIVQGDGAPVTVIDCSVPKGAPTPITFVDWEALHTPTLPSARSLGEMISWWIDALSRGGWSFDAATGKWAEDVERQAEEYRFNPLM